MALQLRPNCEYCDKDLPPNATDARICSYECTFCADCVDNKLHNVCPNCGGGFARRPIRPATERRPGVCVTKQLPSDKRVHLKYSVEDVAAHSARCGIFRRRSAEPHRRHSGAKRSIQPSAFRIWCWRTSRMRSLPALRTDGENYPAAKIVPSTSPKPTR